MYNDSDCGVLLIISATDKLSAERSIPISSEFFFLCNEDCGIAQNKESAGCESKFISFTIFEILFCPVAKKEVNKRSRMRLALVVLEYALIDILFII